MVRFISNASPSLFIPLKNLKYPVSVIQLARGEGVQFSAGIFDTDNPELIFALREFLLDQRESATRPENKNIIINPPYREDGDKIIVVDEPKVLAERYEQEVHQQEESRLIKEFHSYLKG